MKEISPRWVPWNVNPRLAFADRLGFFSLAGMMLLGLSISDLQRLAMILLLLAFFLVAWDLRYALLRSPLAWLSAAWLGYLAVHTLVTGIMHGWEAIDPYIEPDHYARGSVLVAILAGLWVRDDPIRTRWLLGLALVGVVLWLAIYTDWGAVQSLTPGRWVFGDNPNRVALVMLIACLGMLTIGLGWAVRAIHGDFTVATICGVILGVLSVLGAGAALGGIWITGSRQILIACAMTFPVLAVGLIRKIGADRNWTFIGQGLALVTFLVGIVVAVFLLTQVSDYANQRFESRIGNAIETAQDFWESGGDIDIKGSSAQRLFMLTTGWEAVLDRPLFGHGVIDPADWLSPVNQPHWHNLYLQVAFSFGLVGVVLFLSGFFYLIGSYRRAVRRVGVDPYVVFFVAASVLALFVVFLLTVRIDDPLGRWVLTLVFGLMAGPVVSQWFPPARVQGPLNEYCRITAQYPYEAPARDG